jgi:hypothetical protein
MKYILNIVIFYVIVLIHTGCYVHDVYYKRSKSKSVKSRSYPKDQLLLRNHAIYNSRDELTLTNYNAPFEINKDSLSQVLFNSFGKLGLSNLKLDFGENFIDSTLYKKREFNMRLIEPQYLNKLAGNTVDKTILLPIVYSYNRFSFTGFISSGGISGDNGWYILTWLDLIVYIIKDEKIIYSRHIRYKSDQVWAESKEEIEAVPPLAAVKQEHWDELVRLAMEDYIKRLK